MKLPDLLATKRGRLTAFFFLYLTEGIPLGFTAVAIATEMRRQGLGPAAVGAFVASLYAPWGLKWAYGPFVDVLSWDRFGRRRMWIVLMQVLMAATLVAAYRIDFTTQLALFTTFLYAHNLFAATMDVAIDALAVSVLKEEERGLANGFMFAGAYLGQAVGGSGVLFLTAYLTFRTAFFFVAASILLVTLFIAIPLREHASEARAAFAGSALAEVLRRIVSFVVAAVRAMFGSRPAALGLVFAILPAGAYALGLALQSNLAVELGLDNTQVGYINLWSTVLAALGCVAGGWLSDRFGRRLTLAIYIATMSIPTLYLAAILHRHGWVLPVDPQAPHAAAAPALIAAFWTATLVYAVFNGLMYGTRSALFMDITTPAVAATQFTAYMALLNFAIAYSSWWQGRAAERWGYPVTLVIDALAGLVCIALLPFLAPPKKAAAAA